MSGRTARLCRRNAPKLTSLTQSACKPEAGCRSGLFLFVDGVTDTGVSLSRPLGLLLPNGSLKHTQPPNQPMQLSETMLTTVAVAAGMSTSPTGHRSTLEHSTVGEGLRQQKAEKGEQGQGELLTLDDLISQPLPGDDACSAPLPSVSVMLIDMKTFERLTTPSAQVRSTADFSRAVSQLGSAIDGEEDSKMMSNSLAGCWLLPDGHAEQRSQSAPARRPPIAMQLQKLVPTRVRAAPHSVPSSAIQLSPMMSKSLLAQHPSSVPSSRDGSFRKSRRLPSWTAAERCKGVDTCTPAPASTRLSHSAPTGFRREASAASGFMSTIGPSCRATPMAVPYTPGEPVEAQTPPVMEVGGLELCTTCFDCPCACAIPACAGGFRAVAFAPVPPPSSRRVSVEEPPRLVSLIAVPREGASRSLPGSFRRERSPSAARLPLASKDRLSPGSRRREIMSSTSVLGLAADSQIKHLSEYSRMLCMREAARTASAVSNARSTANRRIAVRRGWSMQAAISQLGCRASTDVGATPL